jgi:hypothetical protein
VQSLDQAYVLSQRDEGDVEDEHAGGADIVLHNCPPVVFATHRVSTLAPVVECQTGAPEDRDSHNMVEAERWEAVEVCPNRIVYIVERWDYAPQTIHLRVVLVDLRHDQDNGREKQSDSQRCNERVRRKIDLLQSLQVGDVRSHSVGKVVELRQERLDRLAEVGTFGKSLHERQCRINEGTRIRHGVGGSIDRSGGGSVYFCTLFVTVQR